MGNKSYKVKQSLRNWALLGCSFLGLNAMAQINEQNISMEKPEMRCVGENAVNLADSDIDVEYYLRNDVNDTIIAGPIVGTGSAISIPTGVLDQNMSYNVQAINNDQNPTAIEFKGDGDKVRIKNKEGIFDFSEGTIEFWIKFNENKNTNYAIASMRSTASNTRWSLHINPVTKVFMLWEGKAQIFVQDGNYTPDTWNHVAFVMGSTSTEVFLNGSSVGIIQGKMQDQLKDYDLVIGSANEEAFDHEDFVGFFDNFRLWDKKLTSTEINDLKEKCQLPENENLLVYYSFEEKLGSDSLYDFGGNGHNGILENINLQEAWVEGHMNCNSETRELKQIVNTTFVPLKSGIDLDNGTLTLEETNATFEWVNCAKNNEVVDSQTSSTFTPAKSGVYAAIIKDKGCVSESKCVVINNPIQEKGIDIEEENIVCEGETKVTLESSDDQTTYILIDYEAKKSIGNPIRGTGANLEFPTGNIDKNTTLGVWAEKDYYSNAIEFTGNPNQIKVDANQKLDEAKSVDFWLKMNSGENINYVVAAMRTSIGSTRWSIHVNPATKVILLWNGVNQYPISSSNFNPSDWNHITCVFGDTKTQIYLDGDLLGTVDGTINAGPSNLPLSIGSTNDDLKNESLKGEIDNFRLWKTELDTDGVENSMENFSMGSNENLILNYEFENGGDKVNDQSGNDLHGQLTDIDADNWIASKVSSVGKPLQTTVNLKIDPIDVDVNVNDETLFVNQDDAEYTWMKCDGSLLKNGNQQAFKPNATGSYTVRVKYKSCIDTSGCEIVNTEIKDQTATIKDASTICEGETKVTLASSESETSYYLVDNKEDKIVDGPVQGTGNAIELSTGNIKKNTTFTVVAEKEYISDAIKFTGDPNQIKVDANQKLDDVKSVDFWLKMNSGENVNYVVAGMRTEVGNTRWSLHVNPATKTILLWNVIAQLPVSSSEFTPSEWNHIAYVFGDTKTNIYLNGELLGTVNGTRNTTKSNLPLSIGSTNDNTHKFEALKGELDNFRLWSVELDSAGVSNSMNADTKANTPTLSLTLNYEFKVGKGGNNAIDMTGNQLHGQLNNMDKSNWIVATSSIEDIVAKDIAFSIDPIDVKTTLQGNTITVTQTEDAKYSWMNCLDKSLIDNEKEATFTTSVGGDYAAIVQVKSCIDTSKCEKIIITNLNDANNNDVQVLPTIVSDQLSIHLGNNTNCSIVITDLTGRVITNLSTTTESVVTVETGSLQAGQYLVNVVNETGKSTFKITKQ